MTSAALIRAFGVQPSNVEAGLYWNGLHFLPGLYLPTVALGGVGRLPT